MRCARSVRRALRRHRGRDRKAVPDIDVVAGQVRATVVPQRHDLRFRVRGIGRILIVVDRDGGAGTVIVVVAILLRARLRLLLRACLLLRSLPCRVGLLLLRLPLLLEITLELLLTRSIGGPLLSLSLHLLLLGLHLLLLPSGIGGRPLLGLLLLLPQLLLPQLLLHLPLTLGHLLLLARELLLQARLFGRTLLLLQLSLLLLLLFELLLLLLLRLLLGGVRIIRFLAGVSCRNCEAHHDGEYGRGADAGDSKC